MWSSRRQGGHAQSEKRCSTTQLKCLFGYVVFTKLYKKNTYKDKAQSSDSTDATAYFPFHERDSIVSAIAQALPLDEELLKTHRGGLAAAVLRC